VVSIAAKKTFIILHAVILLLATRVQ